MTRFHVAPMLPADYVDATLGRAPWESAWEAGCARLDCGDAWVARVEGELAAVGGVMRPWPGMGEAWLCLTPVGQAHPIFVVRQAAHLLARQIKTHSLRRVQADVRDYDAAALRLVERLGFKEEGIMECYGPAGEDFIRCARITK